MLKNLLKWAGGAVLLLILVGGGVFLKAQGHYDRTASQVLEDPSLMLEAMEQSGWVQEGERIAKMKGCFDCHGKDMGGQVFVQDPAIGTYAGSNLTKGKGGIGAIYTDQDWVRAIRYGRGPQKQYLKFMPSEEFSFLTDEDLGKLLAYLKALPAVDRERIPVEVGPLAKFFYTSGKMPLLFSGERINLKAQVPVALVPSETAEYGKYLAASCVGCHHPNYAGGAIPGVPPSWPSAANLTPKGNFAKWSFEDFKKTTQSGVTPEGKSLNPQFMPWPSMAAMNETELKALYAFLKALPAAEVNQ